MRPWLLIGGTVFAVLSLPTVLVQAYELLLEHRAYSRYEIQLLADKEAVDFDGNEIRLSASSLHQEAQSISGLGPISIVVNGHDYSEPPTAELPGGTSGASRYYKSAALAILTDREERDRKSLAVVEGLGSLSSKSWVYRILFIDRSGIREERFTYNDRAIPSYRVPLIRLIGPPVGFRFDLLKLWPTWWYPFVYPWLALLVGIIAIFVGALMRRSWSVEARPGEGKRQKKFKQS